jgi:hypothetical protein
VPEFAYIRSAIPPAELEPLRSQLLGSVFVAKSTLTGAFEQSHGFAMTFKQGGRSELERRFPALAAHFTRVLGEPAIRAVQPWWSRLRKRPVELPNAWYMNLLLVGEGGNIKAHTDVTLGREAGLPGTTPRVVSVAYLTVPKRKAGGELVLARNRRIRAVIIPEEGALLHFRGDMPHEVRPVEQMEGGAQRASLVIEQYHFPEEALARLPDFQLDSRAGFGAFLKFHEGREKKDFVIER